VAEDAFEKLLSRIPTEKGKFAGPDLHFIEILKRNFMK
jgi:hypothetical protein